MVTSSLNPCRSTNKQKVLIRNQQHFNELTRIISKAPPGDGSIRFSIKMSAHFSHSQWIPISPCAFGHRRVGGEGDLLCCDSSRGAWPNASSFSREPSALPSYSNGSAALEARSGRLLSARPDAGMHPSGAALLCPPLHRQDSRRVSQ
jgi:hypothetical protein